MSKFDAKPPVPMTIVLAKYSWDSPVSRFSVRTPTALPSSTISSRTAVEVIQDSIPRLRAVA